jgi:DNA modification methylase
MTDRATIVHADALAHLRTMEAGSVDACVTDPPYGLEFMGKEWDNLGARKTKEKTGFDPKGRHIAERGDGWQPGSSYGSPKRMPKCAKCGKWQYNGWKPRECTCEEPEWVHDVSTYPRKMQEWHEAWAREVWRVLKPGAYLLAFGGTRTYHRLACAVEDAGFEIRDQIGWLYGSGFPKSHNLPGGLGTALKTAWEPIVVARKPLAGTVAANVAEYGTGALNVDACRIPIRDEGGVWGARQDSSIGYGGTAPNGYRTERHALGRWPANVCHDGSAEVLEAFARFGEKKTGALKPYTERHVNASSYRMAREKTYEKGEDTGTAARFFYAAKASRSERGEGNGHPTVKPLALMKWLVRLVTPPDGLVLDPFAGSGTTGLACLHEGFRFIGIEKEAEYVEIARARLASYVPLPEQATLAL